jgi:nitric oxide reductase activation protein
MSKLLNSTLETSLSLQLQLLIGIDEAAATAWALFNKEGETEFTTEALDQLQNAVERLKDRYSRLSILLLRVAKAQPVTFNAMLNLLQQTIDSGQGAEAATKASVQEIKIDWGLA